MDAPYSHIFPHRLQCLWCLNSFVPANYCSIIRAWLCLQTIPSTIQSIIETTDDTVFMFKVLNGLAPPYLSDDCQLFSATSRRQLWSSSVQTCATTYHSRLVDRAFAAAGQRPWNSLPAELRQPDLFRGQFGRALKTHLSCWRLLRLVTVFGVVHKCTCLLYLQLDK